MSGGGNRKSRAHCGGGGGGSSEVDELLRAAEDQLLLNLRLDSHPAKSQNPLLSSSSSSFSLDSDLARRFDALKSPTKPIPNTKPNPSDSLERPRGKGISANEESSGILGDDLAARFAALKGSLGPPPPRPSSPKGSSGLLSPASSLGFETLKDSGENEVGVSKKEVEKLMEWAKDAARLDRTAGSDDDENDDDDDDDDDDEDANFDHSDDSEEERKKREQKNKNKPKRWIFF